MSLNFVSNLEDLAEEIGKWKGMSDGINQPAYMHSLITRAFEVAEVKFNMSASLSADDFDFPHMYEYGTSGVGEYTGESGSLDALRTTAEGGGRLWESFLVGGGGRKMITFAFLPANEPNPPKTEENTGITDSRFKPNKLQVNNGKEYIWRQKAMTVENNIAVFVRVRDANLLFVPLQEQPAGTNNTDRERGFTFRKTHAHVPGKWTGGAGQFTAFFAGWWAEQGSEEMELNMMEEFNRDVADWQKRNRPKRGQLKPTQAININGTADAAQKKTRKQWEITARDRQGRVKVL